MITGFTLGFAARLSILSILRGASNAYEIDSRRRGGEDRGKYLKKSRGFDDATGHVFPCCRCVSQFRSAHDQTEGGGGVGRIFAKASQPVSDPVNQPAVPVRANNSDTVWLGEGLRFTAVHCTMPGATAGLCQPVHTYVQ